MGVRAAARRPRHLFLLMYALLIVSMPLASSTQTARPSKAAWGAGGPRDGSPESHHQQQWTSSAAAAATEAPVHAAVHGQAMQAFQALRASRMASQREQKQKQQEQQQQRQDTMQADPAEATASEGFGGLEAGGKGHRLPEPLPAALAHASYRDPPGLEKEREFADGLLLLGQKRQGQPQQLREGMLNQGWEQQVAEAAGKNRSEPTASALCGECVLGDMQRPLPIAVLAGLCTGAVGLHVGLKACIGADAAGVLIGS